jgi:hypothetical protein
MKSECSLVFKRSSHFILFWATWIQCPHINPVSLRSTLILFLQRRIQWLRVLSTNSSDQAFSFIWRWRLNRFLKRCIFSMKPRQRIMSRVLELWRTFVKNFQKLIQITKFIVMLFCWVSSYFASPVFLGRYLLTSKPKFDSLYDYKVNVFCVVICMLFNRR